MCVNYWNDSSKLRMQVITIKNDIIDAISYTHIAIEAQICVDELHMQIMRLTSNTSLFILIWRNH